jgi:hypothetical protein
MTSTVITNRELIVFMGYFILSNMLSGYEQRGQSAFNAGAKPRKPSFSIETFGRGIKRKRVQKKSLGTIYAINW